MKIELSPEIFNFVPCGPTDGVTDMTKLTAAFRNFPKSENSKRLSKISLLLDGFS
jgi:hypothetical protein